MNRYIRKFLKKLNIYRNKENGTVSLISSNNTSVKVCEVVNGKPKVIRKDDEDTVVFILRYSPFHKEVKRYDKRTFKEL